MLMLQARDFHHVPVPLDVCCHQSEHRSHQLYLDKCYVVISAVVLGQVLCSFDSVTWKLNEPDFCSHAGRLSGEGHIPASRVKTT